MNYIKEFNNLDKSTIDNIYHIVKNDKQIINKSIDYNTTETNTTETNILNKQVISYKFKLIINTMLFNLIDDIIQYINKSDNDYYYKLANNYITYLCSISTLLISNIY